MAEVMTARARHILDMRFEGESGSGHAVPLDAAFTDGGENTGFRPMELLLVGLAGCTGMDVISILRKKQQQVTAYEVRVEGIRSQEHPMVFVEIIVEHIITGIHIQPEAVVRAINLSVQRYCGAEAMLGQVANITHTFRILKAPTALVAADAVALALPAD